MKPKITSVIASAMKDFVMVLVSHNVPVVFLQCSTGLNFVKSLQDHVPIEIVFVILSLLGTKELCKVSLLNSFYLRLSKDESLWKPFCSSWGIDEGTIQFCDQQYFTLAERFALVLGVNWKDLFKRGLQDQRNMLQRIEECRKTRLRLDSGWIVEKGGSIFC